MNYANRELRDRLASEYALGTLRGAARRRFERLMDDDPSLRDLAEDWERRLGLLAEAAPRIEPSPRVWKGIVGRLPPKPAPNHQGWLSWFRSSVEFWRGASLLTAAAAATAVIFLAFQQRPDGERDQIAALDARLAHIDGTLQLLATAPEAMRALADRLAEVESRLDATLPKPSHVAVLIDKYRRPMMTADLDISDGRLVLKLHITPPRDFTDRVLEVWLEPQGGVPRSLGLLPSEKAGTTTVLALSHELALALASSTLVVSLEPAGGSSTARPTGPVLFSGPVVPVDL